MESELKQIQILKPSIQSLYVEVLSNSKKLANGTCFLLEKSNRTYLLTNWHVVTGINPITGERMGPAQPDSIAVWHNMRGNLGVFGKCLYNLYDENRNPVWYEHPDWKNKFDCIAIPLAPQANLEFYPYEWSDDAPYYSQLSPTDIISVIGFPFGETSGNKDKNKIALWPTGSIVSEPLLDYEDLPRFLIDCRTREGSSGSPVVFHRNAGGFPSKDGMVINKKPFTRLLGIYSGRLNEHSDLGIVWKSQAIGELIDSVGAKK